MAFIVLLDEPDVLVFESADVAAMDIEGPEAESGLRAAYDDAAVPHHVEWVRPNKWRGRWLKSVEPGEYKFVPSGPPDPDALATLIADHSEHLPTEKRTQLDAIVASLRTA